MSGRRTAGGRYGELPPGQELIERFPRFGVPRRVPRVPRVPVLTIGGAVTKAIDVPLAALATGPRRAISADFHCVSGWSFAALDWEGVPFAAFYAATIAPLIEPGAAITHVVFAGLDGYRSVLQIEDALANHVLLADRLHGRPLDDDHGAPLRLISPLQYGYVSTKHLCRIEVHTTAPRDSYGPPFGGAVLFERHPRARVWEEERHRFLPAWLVRRLYRPLIRLFIRLNARTAEGGRR